MRSASTLLGLLAPLFLLVGASTGCQAVTHPRYAPELVQRWPDCTRIVVMPGTVSAEAKNYLADDYFHDESRGNACSKLFADEVRRVLRDEGRREPRYPDEAVAALGGDSTRARAVADGMLKHAREWMARDPGYDEPALHGLAADPGVVPYELRRNFDAVVVVGGRTKYESHHELMRRWEEIAVRNALAFPLTLISPLVPFALPVSLAVLLNGPGGYWQSAPNVSYFQVAVFDCRTGRLLYTNDWFKAEAVLEREDYHDMAGDLLKHLVKVKLVDEAPLGERPPGWSNGLP